MNVKNSHLKLVNNRRGQPGWKKAFNFLLRLAVFAVLLLLLKHGETYFRVNEVEVQGTGELTAEEVISAAQITRGMSIILLKEDDIASNIEQEYPMVRNVEVSRILPDRIMINIDERRPVAHIMTADGFWLMDSQAVPFAYRAEPEDDFPVIKGVEGELVIPGIPVDCKARREALRSFFAAWNGDSGFEIEQINMADNYNLVVLTVEGLEIWFGDGKDMADKMNLVNMSMPYINPDPEARLDVRSGNRLVVSSSAILKEEGVDP